VHVIIGTIFLIVALIRLINYHLTNLHHFGFEAGAWYWHKKKSLGKLYIVPKNQISGNS